MEKYQILENIKNILSKNNLSLSTAESCTGGLISSYLTDISGASEFIFQNFVTYSNSAKEKFLSVKEETLNKFGAVSFETAYEMVSGLFNYADCAIATTGILGPGGGNIDKPVGLVYIGVGYSGKIKVIKYNSLKKERYEIKKDITKKALIEFLSFLRENIK